MRITVPCSAFLVRQLMKIVTVQLQELYQQQGYSGDSRKVTLVFIEREPIPFEEPALFHKLLETPQTVSTKHLR